MKQHTLNNLWVKEVITMKLENILIQYSGELWSSELPIRVVPRQPRMTRPLYHHLA